MKKVIYLIAIALIIAACNKGNKVVEQTYKDGSPKVEKYYKGEGASKEMVKQVTYYPNKQKQMEGGFKDSLRDGYWVYYYRNGNKWSEGYFTKGLDEGRRTTYYENGSKHYEGNFLAGKRVGKWKFYDHKGKMLKEIDYNRADTTRNKVRVKFEI